MTNPPMVSPMLDPTSIFEVFRGNLGTELLTAAVSHFRVFERLSHGAMTFDELRRDLGLAERPTIVLVTALRAFGLLLDDEEGQDQPDRAGPRSPDTRVPISTSAATSDSRANLAGGSSR